MPEAFIVALEIYCRTFTPEDFPSALASKEAMHKRSVDMVRSEWPKVKLTEMWPAFIVASVKAKNVVLSCDMRWKNGNEKRAMFTSVSNILKEHGADFYSFIAETRVKTQDVKTGEIKLEHEDAISIVTSDRKGKALHSGFYKDPDGSMHPLECNMHSGHGEGITALFLAEGALYDDLASAHVEIIDLSA